MTAYPLNSVITIGSGTAGEAGVVSGALQISGAVKISEPISGSVNITNQLFYVSGSVRAILTDSGTNPISSYNDSGTNRLSVDASIKYGASVSPNAFIPSNPNNIRYAFVKNAGTASLKVNGSTTPVTYTFGSDSTYDTRLSEIRLIMAGGLIDFNGSTFAGGRPLTSGVVIDVATAYGTSTLATLQQNEDFIAFASRDGCKIEHGGTNDMLIASLDLASAIILRAGSGDNVRIRVQDNLTGSSYQISYFQASVYGSKG